MESPDDPTPPAEPAAPAGFRLVSMIADDGREPPTSTTDAEATGSWSAASSPWHPALLAVAADLPRFEDVALPTDPEAGEVRLVAAGQMGRLPVGYYERARDAGVPIVEATADRLATTRAVVEALRTTDGSIPSFPDVPDPLVDDFLALGACHWWVRDLTIAMGHVDTLSRSSLLREAVAGGKAWRDGDRVAAENHARAGFDLLTEARERFYPLDGYVLDFCLLDPATAPDGLEPILDAERPFTLVASAAAVEAFAERRPDLAARLRAAIDAGWADVAGGAHAEVDEPFLPWASLAYQFTRGSDAYRRHLDDRNVETLARRRFGLYPQLPQVARRFGLRYAWLVALDEGRFPVVAESKRQWAAPDGTTVEAITRPPVAADRPIEGARVAWRVAKSMQGDGVATLPLARWPEPVAPWFADLRRSGKYSPVLGRWVTANDYFRYSDRPFDEVTLNPDDLSNAYLSHAAARRDPSPIARRAAHARRRAEFDALRAVEALAACLAGTPDAAPTDPDLEARVEADPTGPVGDEIRAGLYSAGAQLAALIGGHKSDGEPGYLVFNPLGVARRVRVDLAGGAPVAEAGPALKASQPSAGGTLATVEVAPFGFAWIGAAARADAGPPAHLGSASARDRKMSTDTVVASVDPATGGVRGVNLVGEESARLGQQLVIHGLVGPDGKPAASRMRADSVQVDATGPAAAQITSRGTIRDPASDRVLARFTQVAELASGRPNLELTITLDEVDADWLARAAASDPWGHYLACRWAWPDPQSTLRRSALLAMYPTEADRPETPDAFDVTSRQRRTTLLFGGLAHHRRVGPRMLDTLLVAGSESARTFRLAVNMNLEHAFPSVLDFVTPALVARTDSGPPPSGPVGWLARVDSKSVAILRLTFARSTNEGQGWGIVVDLVETAGRAARCRLATFRDPTHARQVNGHGDHIVDLQFDRDGASVDLTPHEIARVEITFGPRAGLEAADGEGSGA